MKLILSILISEILFFAYPAVSAHYLVEENTSQNGQLHMADAYESSPIPQGKLDPEILADFIPLIMKEVSNEFVSQNDSRTRRDTRQYGFNFFKMLNGDFSYSPPPKFFQELGAHICKAFGHEPVEFTNIILSLYEKDFHLEPHVDVNAKDRHSSTPFYFGERVYGIVIESDPTGHLYFLKWEDAGLVPPLDIEPIYSLKEENGTIFCLEGKFRKTPYFHAVSTVSKRRISVTFRTVERILE